MWNHSSSSSSSSSSSIVPFWCGNTNFTFTENFSTVYLIPYHCSKIEINLTSCKAVQTESEMETIRLLCQTGDVVWFSVFWFAVVVGLIGNSLAFITVASLPVSIATFYVGLLAVSDFTALALQLAIYFLSKERLINPTTPYWHIFPILFDFCMSYSNWLLVLICLDRFISIRFPLKRRFYFTLRHAKISSFTMGAVLFAVYFAFVQTIGYMDTRMFIARNLLYSQIPLVFILILIVLIVIQFKNIRRNRKFLSESGSNTNTTTGGSGGGGAGGSGGSRGGGSNNLNTNNQSNTSNNSLRTNRNQSGRSTPSHDSTTPLKVGGSSNINSSGSCSSNNSNSNTNTNCCRKSSTHHNNHNNNSTSINQPHQNNNSSFQRRTNVFEDVERLENNLTIMMLVTAICFAILTIPNCVMLFTYRHADTHWNTPLARARWNVFSKTSQVLTFLNLSINFILYFLSAKKFRHQLCHRLLRCRGRKKSPYNSTYQYQNNTTMAANTQTEQSETFL